MGVLKDLSKGKYQRTMVSSQSKGENAKQGMVSQEYGSVFNVTLSNHSEVGTHHDKLNIGN